MLQPSNGVSLLVMISSEDDLTLHYCFQDEQLLPGSVDDCFWNGQHNLEMRVSALPLIARVAIYFSFLCKMGVYKLLCSIYIICVGN